MRSRAAIVVPAAALALFGIEDYRRELRRDRERLAAVARRVVDTPFGRVEFAQAGHGRPVLVVHGVFGGCDFGVAVGRVNVPPGFAIISPSRFGFLGSPFPRDRSSAAQADAFAALLDHLRIAEVVVVAFSAGSTSALQLALRHPQRVSRLLLISPNAPHPEPLPKPPPVLAPFIFSQPVFWAMRRLAPARLEAMFGTPPGFIADEREQAALDEILDSLFPVGPRAPGTIYDAYVGNLDIASYPLEAITVPTLVVHAEDDALSPYRDSRAMADRIPGVRFVSVPRGDHALTHLDPLARRTIEQFLGAATAPAPIAAAAP